MQCGAFFCFDLTVARASLTPQPTPLPPPKELVNSTRYQLRAYGLPTGQSFSTASVKAGSWAGATSSGFRANFAYIEGENDKKVKIPMTAPVVTRNPGGDEANWLVSFFTPQSIYATAAAAPKPTGENMRIEPMPLSTFAVVEFGGEAVEADYKVATALLKEALQADNVTLADASDPWAEAWCGYDGACGKQANYNARAALQPPALTTYATAPNDFVNRHNEAWVKVILS